MANEKANIKTDVTEREINASSRFYDSFMAVDFKLDCFFAFNNMEHEFMLT